MDDHVVTPEADAIASVVPERYHPAPESPQFKYKHRDCVHYKSLRAKTLFCPVAFRRVDGNRHIGTCTLGRLRVKRSLEDALAASRQRTEEEVPMTTETTAPEGGWKCAGCGRDDFKSETAVKIHQGRSAACRGKGMVPPAADVPPPAEDEAYIDMRPVEQEEVLRSGEMPPCPECRAEWTEDDIQPAIGHPAGVQLSGLSIAHAEGCSNREIGLGEVALLSASVVPAFAIDMALALELLHDELALISIDLQDDRVPADLRGHLSRRLGLIYELAESAKATCR